MDKRFTEKLQRWLLTPDEKKDWEQGAILLLQCTNNKIMYRNISVNPKAKAEFIKGKLQQHLNFRLAEVTHEEVQQMEVKVEEITKKTIKPEMNFKEFKAGKRLDHDSLPEEIQARYVENLDIVHRMRELHLQLRKLSTVQTTCPDSERYPFLKELIALDKQLHENWDTYDHYVVVTASQAVVNPPSNDVANPPSDGVGQPLSDVRQQPKTAQPLSSPRPRSKKKSKK